MIQLSVLSAAVAILGGCRPSSDVNRDAGIQCMNNLHRLGMAMLMYTDENKGCFPLAASWCDQLQPYATALGFVDGHAEVLVDSRLDAVDASGQQRLRWEP